MRQRVALARTLATDPALLLMDEPFAALDAQTCASARSIFLDIWDDELDRKTVLFVTHDLAEALLVADRVVSIVGGRVRTRGWSDLADHLGASARYTGQVGRPGEPPGVVTGATEWSTSIPSSLPQLPGRPR
jgi:NitT/TauT family transport system ATP-binding protein